MEQEVRSYGWRIAQQASQRARAWDAHGPFKYDPPDAYNVHTVNHDWTAVAFVQPHSERGVLDNLYHHTLDSFNH